MPATRKKRQREENPYFKKSYATAEEGAQAKADYMMNVVLKDFDWNQFDEMRKKEGEKRYSPSYVITPTEPNPSALYLPTPASTASSSNSLGPLSSN